MSCRRGKSFQIDASFYAERSGGKPAGHVQRIDPARVLEAGSQIRGKSKHP
jgi:hypothetical protein